MSVFPKSVEFPLALTIWHALMFLLTEKKGSGKGKMPGHHGPSLCLCVCARKCWIGGVEICYVTVVMIGGTVIMALL